MFGIGCLAAYGLSASCDDDNDDADDDDDATEGNHRVMATTG